MRRLRFIKMEGAGNDYVYINGWRQVFAVEDAARLVPLIANRNFGVGGDGVILLTPSQRADVRMFMWNADGSRGGMCGNGVRCLAKLAYDEHIVHDLRLTVETDGGVRQVELLVQTGEVVGARVDMGDVRVDCQPRSVTVGGQPWAFHAGDAGNPHAVIFTADDVDALPVAAVGAVLQRTPPFTDGVNVEFVQVLPDGSLRQRTFERGAGETLACGSGATVAATAAVRTGRVPGPRVPVQLRGGRLVIEVGAQGAIMEGPAREVFRGEVDFARALALLGPRP
jgi:diaminopimelate epimerase